MEDKNPKCPVCDRKLYHRVKADGYVCKNWRNCPAHHKCGRGFVFDEDGNFKRLQNISVKIAIGDLLSYIKYLE